MNSMQRVLTEALVEVLAFIDMSDEDTLDQDAATNQLESAAATLQKLTADERQELLGHIQVWATELQQEFGSIPFIRFLQSFGKSLGLEPKEENPTKMVKIRNIKKRT